MDAEGPFDHLWSNARLATFDPAVSAPYGLREGWALGVRGETIAAILPPDSEPIRRHRGEVTDCRGRLITPGLIDCHTHIVYGGSRAAEWEMRLAGVPYAEIARRGGGILSTVRATRAMTEDDLVAAALPRLQALVQEGVTCVEIKSGYGLTTDDELKMLRAARRLGKLAGVEVSATLLAAHAVPPEFAGRADDYVSLIVEEMIPSTAHHQLAEAVDVFCESIAFSVPQCDRIFAAAKKHNLGVKGHVEQLSNSHGAELIARYGGWSADHLEYLDEAGVADAGESRHCRGALAWRVLLPSREAEAAGGQAPRRWRADGCCHRPEPRHVSVRIASTGHEHGVRALRPHARGSARRRHSRSGQGTRPRRSAWDAGSRQVRRFPGLGCRSSG